MTQQPGIGQDDGRDDEAVRRFIERFALDLTDAGMPRMPARVFAAVFAAPDGKRTAADLADLLQVSPAAISGGVRYLLHQQMVARERDPGERRDHYRIYQQTWYAMIARREGILERWISDLDDGVKAVGPDTPAGERLGETRDFLKFLHDEMAGMLDKWSRLRGQRQPDDA